MHLEPHDSENWETAARKRACYRNLQLIRTNMQRLVRIFRRPEMYAKLSREFRDIVQRPSGNEISNFLFQFENLQTLWNSKLCTSLEEQKRMTE